MNKARIFNIQRFSLHDGPGIRTVVFFKGCSLRCKWCANPEGISFDLELRHNPRVCRHCGSCAANCPAKAIKLSQDEVEINRSLCQKCGTCIEKCPASALEWCGDREYTVDELFNIVKRESMFYRSSNGGVTLSGGEALMQNDFAVEFLKRCKDENINTAIETAGNYPWRFLERAAPFCDTIFFDIKGWDSEKTQYCIGADIRSVAANLGALSEWIDNSEHKPELIVRNPIIPEYNFDPADYENFIQFARTLKSLTRVDILPFHNLGEYKYTQLGKEYDFKGRDNLNEEAVEEYRQIAEKYDVTCTVTTV